MSNARHQHPRPPPVPPGFWDDPGLRRALAEQHMGRVVAAYRHHPAHHGGLRQVDVARWADLSQARLSRLETGPAPKHLDDLAFWARLLSIPPGLLWFRMPAPPHPIPPPQDPVSPPVDRRYRLLRFDDHLSPDEADIAAMETFRQADRCYGGGRLYTEVLDYWTTRLAPRLFSGDNHPAPNVFVAAAAIVEMGGWMAHDAGYDDRADRQFQRAAQLSTLGRDRQLIGHIHASRAHLQLHRGDPKHAIQHAYEAEMVLSKAPPDPELTAHVLAMQARCHAATGDARRTRALLARAEHTLDHDTTAVRSPWISRFDHGSLAAEATRSLRRLGDLTGAAETAQRIIDLRPPGRTRSRALGQLIYAAILADQGHPEHACAIAEDVLGATVDRTRFLPRDRSPRRPTRETGALSHEPTGSRLVRPAQPHDEHHHVDTPPTPPGLGPDPIGVLMSSVQRPQWDADPEGYRARLAQGNARQPRKRVGADGLILDNCGRILLVDPNYKPDWDLPGGMAEANEPPVDALRRELDEELGLHLETDPPLLCVDWVPPHNVWDDSLMFIFNIGILDDDRITQLHTTDDELDAFAFVTPDQASQRLRPYVWARLAAALDAATSGHVAYLHNGQHLPRTIRAVRWRESEC